MIEPLFGYECIVANQIKKQKKTNKCKIINWFYKKVYGYKYYCNVDLCNTLFNLKEKLGIYDLIN